MSDRPTATTNRRTILKAGSTLALAGLITPAATVAQTDLPIEIEQFPEEEYVVLRNVGDDDVDLTGYSINFEAEDEDYNQVRQLSGDVVLGPGEEVSVATGDETTVSTDVTLVDPYDGFVLNNDGTDEVALLDPDGNEVVSTDGSGDGSDSSDGDDGDDGDSSDSGDGDSSDGGDGDDGDDSDDDGTDSSGDDEGGGSDGSDESTDDSANDDEDKGKTDADGDGVAATDDADDDCAKVS